MSGRFSLEQLLAFATLRLDIGDRPCGTAFVVTPEAAVTAAHVVFGAADSAIGLHGPGGTLEGEVADVRPSAGSWVPSSGEFYPPPDVALIKLRGHPARICARLGRQRPVNGTVVTVRGHTRSFSTSAVTTETESFTLTGDLETPDERYPLLKLSNGQAVPGMSGAPVLDVRSGDVIGMLRSSRNARSSLGAWIVPAEVIRSLWPEVSEANDAFHAVDGRWARAVVSEDDGHADPGRAPDLERGVTIGRIEGSGPVTVISGGNFGDMHIGDARSPGGGRQRPSQEDDDG